MKKQITALLTAVIMLLSTSAVCANETNAAQPRLNAGKAEEIAKSFSENALSDFADAAATG